MFLLLAVLERGREAGDTSLVRRIDVWYLCWFEDCCRCLEVTAVICGCICACGCMLATLALGVNRLFFSKGFCC